ncbi:hypothetical protein BH10ACT11_BH10ACT11_21450 [soil metagenome]
MHRVYVREGHEGTAGAWSLHFRFVPLSWTDEIDEILGGDLAAAFAHLTPAKGVVVTPMAPLGLRDRKAGTVTVTTAIALHKKLAAVRRDPKVAVVYHAREHSLTDRPEFVVVQGRGLFPEQPDREWLESITPQWERFLGPRAGGLAGAWMSNYYWVRVPIVIEVERIISLPSAFSDASATVHGSPRPPDPEPQTRPSKGVEPRVGTERVAADARRLPHSVLSWAGGDGYPAAAEIRVESVEPEGLRISAAPGLLPLGGRRAGLTSHLFEKRMHGQEQRIHTGWLEVDESGGTYSPHTRGGYKLPASQPAFTLACGIVRARKRGARKAGFNA